MTLLLLFRRYDPGNVGQDFSLGSHRYQAGYIIKDRKEEINEDQESQEGQEERLQVEPEKLETYSSDLADIHEDRERLKGQLFAFDANLQALSRLEEQIEYAKRLEFERKLEELDEKRRMLVLMQFYAQKMLREQQEDDLLLLLLNSEPFT